MAACCRGKQYMPNLYSHPHFKDKLKIGKTFGFPRSFRGVKRSVKSCVVFWRKERISSGLSTVALEWQGAQAIIVLVFEFSSDLKLMSKAATRQDGKTIPHPHLMRPLSLLTLPSLTLLAWRTSLTTAKQRLSPGFACFWWEKRFAAIGAQQKQIRSY